MPFFRRTSGQESGAVLDTGGSRSRKAVSHVIHHRWPVVDVSIVEALGLEPDDRSYLAALRVFLSMAVPTLLLFAFGAVQLAPWAVFGGFAAIYGRTNSPWQRAKVQFAVGATLVVSVAIGLLIAGSEQSAWLAIVVGSLVATGVGAASLRFHWRPIGPLFSLIAFSIASRADAGLLPQAVGTTAGAAALSVAIGASIGRVRDGGAGHLTLPKPHVSPLTWVAAEFGLSAGLAGALAHLSGLDHAYWAMFSAVVPFMATDRPGQILRALYRVVGTLLGLLLASLILSILPRGGLPAILVVIVLQAGVELVIQRHYGLAVLLVTPLALVMSQTVDSQPVPQLLLERSVQTLLGAGVAVVVVVIAHRMRERHDLG